VPIAVPPSLLTVTANNTPHRLPSWLVSDNNIPSGLGPLSYDAPTAAPNPTTFLSPDSNIQTAPPSTLLMDIIASQFATPSDLSAAPAASDSALNTGLPIAPPLTSNNVVGSFLDPAATQPSLLTPAFDGSDMGDPMAIDSAPMESAFASFSPADVAPVAPEIFAADVSAAITAMNGVENSAAVPPATDAVFAADNATTPSTSTFAQQMEEIYTNGDHAQLQDFVVLVPWAGDSDIKQ